MDKKYDEFVGVDKLHAALVTEDSEDNYVAEEPEYLAPSAEIVNDTPVDSQDTYYDNVPANSYNTEGATTVTMTLSGVPANLAAKYLGKTYDEASGRMIDSGSPNAPDAAISFRFNKGSNNYKYFQYLKGKFSGGTEEAATKNTSVDIKTYQMTFKAVVTTKQWLQDGEMKGVKKITGETTDPNFNASTWFDFVQTPDAPASPEAFTLSSSDPADEATGIAVDSDVVLTFSNAVKSYAMTLYDASFAPVSATITKDATGKILTLTPESNLSGTTSYVLVISEVKDIYGQAINDQVIGFTTV